MSAPASSTVRVSLEQRSYEIRISSGGIVEAGDFAAELAREGALPQAFVVTDSNVRSPHGDQVTSSLQLRGFSVELAVLEPGEQTKSAASAAALYDRLAESAADRRTLVVAVGGGVIGDLAGFVAATYLRGVPYVQVPTTLLAQVDSSVGGKVAVNHPKGKNLIGAFYQPAGVLIDTGVLATLPERQYRCGLAEVVKYGVILDTGFFEYLESHVAAVNARDPDVLRHIVSRCCQLKARVVTADEREESGQRAVLNYGHTFAHAFESLGGYRLLHGEAVAVGMVCASRLAESLGMIEADVTRRQVDLLAALGLPTSVREFNTDTGVSAVPSRETTSGRVSRMQPVKTTSGTGVSPVLPSMSAEAMVAAMRHDKKAVGGRPRFVLPTRLGHVEQVADVDPDCVRAVLER